MKLKRLKQRLLYFWHVKVRKRHDYIEDCEGAMLLCRCGSYRFKCWDGGWV